MARSTLRPYRVWTVERVKGVPYPALMHARSPVANWLRDMLMAHLEQDLPRRLDERNAPIFQLLPWEGIRIQRVAYDPVEAPFWISLLCPWFFLWPVEMPVLTQHRRSWG
jgi:hypothetical protein